MTKVFNVQTEGGQGEIQDYDLHQQTAVQTVAATDYVMLQDTNGAYHKILRNSLVDAIRDVLGASIGGAALGTDIQKIPALGTNDVLGFGTLANIASVLGGLRYLKFVTNVDNTTVSGLYYVASPDSPTGLEGWLIVISAYTSGDHSGVGVIQTFINFNNMTSCVQRIRNWDNNTWGNWCSVAFDIPSFYKDYANLSSLASALGVGGFVLGFNSTLGSHGTFSISAPEKPLLVYMQDASVSASGSLFIAALNAGVYDVILDRGVTFGNVVDSVCIERESNGGNLTLRNNTDSPHVIVVSYLSIV